MNLELAPSARDLAAWQQHLPPGMSADALDLLAQQSLPRAWKQRWNEQPDAVAVVDVTGSTERVVTRGELDRTSAIMAALLQARGVRPGDRVLVSAGTSLSLLSLYVGVLRLGAVAVPANTAYREREIGHIVRDSRPVLAIVDDPARASWVRAASPAGDACPVVDPQAVDDAEPPAPATAMSLDRAVATDLAMICYTSGTTGSPKGAMLTHGNLLASAEALRLAWRWTESDGLVLALPLFHIHGLGVGVHGSLLTGARVLLLSTFVVADVLAAAQRLDATLFFGVPTMYVRLVEALRDNPEGAQALASLRLLVSGSAPLPPAVWEEIRTLTDQNILERYGMTETIMNVSNPYDGERRPGTVGLPLPGVQVRVRVGGREAADDEVGDIHVRGPNVFPGYWERPDATAEAFCDDGWFQTGDLGVHSADGYITIAGRAKELIITGGYNVYPREVEEVLEEHPAVAEAAVVGQPSPEWGEEVVGYVVPVDAEHAPAAADLDAWCRERLAGYKRPRSFTIVDRLPRNALGKLVKSELQR